MWAPPARKVAEPMKTLLLILTAALLAAAPAGASVAEGVAEWRAGNYREAVLLWLPAAARGNPHALFNLGLAHRQGRGVPEDRDRAEDFFRRAAEKGHAPARTYLGILLARRGEEAEAIKMWRESAAAGDAHARYMLGIRHFNGRDVPKDLPRAYAYMTLADEQGLSQAERALARMETTLSEADKVRGRSLAAELRGRPAAGLASAVPAPQRAPVRAAAANESTARAVANRPQQVRGVSIPAGQQQAFRVQLGAFGNRSQAEAGWANMQQRLPSILASAEPVFRDFAGGVRLRVGTFDERSEAVSYCDDIKAAGQPCFVAAE